MNLRRSKKRRPKGFTLLEVLVATIVVGMVLSLVYQAFSHTIETKNVVEAGNEMYHQIRWALDKMAYDLSCAYVGKGKNANSQFLGLSQLSGDGIPQDELHFTSFSHVRYSQNEKSSDQCELSYFIAQDPLTGQYVLFRREDYTLDDDLSTGGEILELVEGIVAFNIRYYNGDSWVDTWDSRDFSTMEENFVEVNSEQSEEMINAIPAAVEIAISMADEKGQEVFLTTKVKLMLSSIDLSVPEEDDDDDDSSSDKDSTDKGKTSGGSTSSSPGLGGYIGAG